jgi:hypothetical protein
MIYMAEWMLTAYDVDPDPAKARYRHLAQKIYSHAKEMDWESLVDSSTADNEYFPSRQYEEKSGVHDLIDDYDTDSFWDQLVDRLTERDVEIQTGTTADKPLSYEAYSALADPIADKYEREFAANGLERIKIDDA